MPSPKVQEKEESRRLRAVEGMSIKAIARQVGVSPGSVSAWVRGIDLTESQKAILRKTMLKSGLKGAQTRASTARACRQASQELGRAVAHERDWLHVAGCMLYWAEGTKGRNSVRLSNSDAPLLRLFLRCLRERFGVRDEDIRVTCTFYADSAEEIQIIEGYWLDVLQLPPSALRKSIINRYPNSSYGQKKGKLPMGVCEVAVDQTDLVQQIYGAIQEYSGVAQPQWLG